MHATADTTVIKFPQWLGAARDARRSALDILASIGITDMKLGVVASLHWGINFHARFGGHRTERALNPAAFFNPQCNEAATGNLVTAFQIKDQAVKLKKQSEGRA